MHPSAASDERKSLLWWQEPGQFPAFVDSCVGDDHCDPRCVQRGDMRVPDDFVRARRGQIDLLLCRFRHNKIICADGKAVTACAFTDELNDDLTCSGWLRCHGEVEKV